jgi:hypothetical protein
MTFKEFVSEIETYESDTFSATSSKINRAEAKKVAEKILGRLVNAHLDGVLISAYLEDIRDKD